MENYLTIKKKELCSNLYKSLDGYQNIMLSEKWKTKKHIFYDSIAIISGGKGKLIYIDRKKKSSTA